MPEFNNGNEWVVRAKITNPLPDWRLLVSDIVCDMRFLLDNLAYELVVANTGMEPPPNVRRIQFPISGDRGEFMETDRKGKPTYRSGRTKMEDMGPWVQRLIEAIQPYHDVAGGVLPQESGLLILNEMCNTYKHRLLVPILLKFQKIKISIQAEGCSVSALTPVQNVGELKDGVVVATFLVERYSDKAEIHIATQLFTNLGFPAGVFAEFHNILDFGLQGLHIVRAIIAALTEVQWGGPMDLPETLPHFVTPLAITIPNLYGP
jgi:hypothetical protein